MSDWNRQSREAERARRREEREALKRQRELARQIRLQEKLDDEERARLEVQEHAARIDGLLSLHRECGPPWDWLKLSASLAPVPPMVATLHEDRARRDLMLLPDRLPDDRDGLLALARDNDHREFAAADNQYRSAHMYWQNMTLLARRILAGDTVAYRDAVEELSPLIELVDLGSLIDFTMKSATTIECALTMNGTQVIPTENKTLTASGKLSVRAMSRQQFHEIYQDYICGGVLRVARESFALLPIEHIIVTALAPLDGGTEKPVLSVVVNREDLLKVNFDQVDASDMIDRLVHRGDFKATRKSGAFQPITPFTFGEIATGEPGRSDLTTLRARLSAEGAAVRTAQQDLQERLT